MIKIRLKIIQLKKMRFIKVDGLKLTQVEIAVVVVFVFTLCVLMLMVPNCLVWLIKQILNAFLYHSNLSF